MIRVHDNKQNIETPVMLTTINCDGMYRYWNADSMDEFHRWWWDEYYDGPSGDDKVVELFVNGYKEEGIRDFEDIVIKYGFDEEVEVGKLEFEQIEGKPEYDED